MGTITPLDSIRAAVERDTEWSTNINLHYKVTPTKHGLMLLNRHDPVLEPTLDKVGEWAWNEVEITRQYAHGNVVDCGANIGMNTLIYAQSAERVFSFEPQPLVFFNLCANLLLNNVLNVTPVMCALGFENGHVPMIVADPTTPNCPTGSRIGEGDFTVAIRTLDSLGLPPISFMKIDVEGHELQVLMGALGMLERDHPVLYIEIHYKHLIEKVNQLLENFGYSPTPAIITHVFYPDTHQSKPDDMLEVYGYLYSREQVPGE